MIPLKYQRITQRQNWNPKNLLRALNDTKNGMPIKTAARNFSVPVMSLKRKAKNKNVIAKDNIKHHGSKRRSSIQIKKMSCYNILLNWKRECME